MRIATLTGTPAPAFSLPPHVLQSRACRRYRWAYRPTCCERRPDVASAERAMAAANAQIGVAKAAYFPSIPLAAGYGAESNALGSLFQCAAPTCGRWAYPRRRRCSTPAASRSTWILPGPGYQATVAQYRQTVLTAMQEVEDGITGLSSLERAAAEACRRRQQRATRGRRGQ